MSSSELNIDLNPHDLSEVRNILKKHIPHLGVWAFGSRVKWTAKSYSDLDLALLTEKPLAIHELAEIKEAFDESSLIVKVDLVDWAKTSENFKKIIEEQKVVVQFASSVAATDWKPYKILEIGKVVTGKTPKDSAPCFEDKFPFITPPDFNGQKWISSPVRFVSRAAASTVKNCILPPESVLVTCIGSDMGKAAINTQCCITNQQINAIVVDRTKFSSEFIFYNLSLRKDEIRQMAGGYAQPILNKTAFSELWISCPPIDMQKSIVDVLRPLDDRIALLRETNATLEAIAQALFKSWFVDFDPVLYNSSANASTQPPSLPAEMQALFPSRLVESPQGLIPEGWECGAISDYAELNPESWTAKKHPETVAYIDLANAKDNVIADIAEFEFSEATSRARRVLKDGDTIVGTVRPGNRSFAFIYDAASNLTGNTGFAVLRPKHPRNTAFVYLAATNDSSIDHLTHVADGGAYPAVRPDVVAALTCVCAPTNVLEAFNEVSAELLCKISKNLSQAQTLANLRDTLLPRLIAGQLRLPDAEAALAEV